MLADFKQRSLRLTTTYHEQATMEYGGLLTSSQESTSGWECVEMSSNTSKTARCAPRRSQSGISPGVQHSHCLLLKSPGLDIALDFIIGLPESQKSDEGTSYNAILVIVDWFSKMMQYIPVRNTNDTAKASQYASTQANTARC